jgi:hypothetical protein
MNETSDTASGTLTLNLLQFLSSDVIQFTLDYFDETEKVGVNVQKSSLLVTAP